MKERNAAKLWQLAKIWNNNCSARGRGAVTRASSQEELCYGSQIQVPSADSSAWSLVNADLTRKILIRTRIIKKCDGGKKNNSQTFINECTEPCFKTRSPEKLMFGPKGKVKPWRRGKRFLCLFWWMQIWNVQRELLFCGDVRYQYNYVISVRSLWFFPPIVNSR